MPVCGGGHCVVASCGVDSGYGSKNREILLGEIETIVALHSDKIYIVASIVCGSLCGGAPYVDTP